MHVIGQTHVLPFAPWQRSLGLNWTRSWVGPIVGLDPSGEERRIWPLSDLCRNVNHDCLVAQPVALNLYPLSCPSCTANTVKLHVLAFFHEKTFSGSDCIKGSSEAHSQSGRVSTCGSYSCWGKFGTFIHVHLNTKSNKGDAASLSISSTVAVCLSVCLPMVISFDQRFRCSSTYDDNHIMKRTSITALWLRHIP